ncbi:DUF6527 family protein [Mycobacterium europaeum]|uniref:DUF6527 family protein n=1 Tax=Mycobacterium europaeum TaxID=761804 RepID=UPI002AE04578|nr:DUF6527 family protein [Mycobacterium europaeum]MEA1157895.1 DUF6527 family protein [Mycobacterium europaeum]
MRHTTLTPEFVEYIPSQLDDGALYVSIPYCTAVHKCACGCGYKVVTPISPADWQILFDGEAVSLFPSVGNWEFPCQTHYWIRSNRVIRAKTCTPEQIARGRAREDRARREYFARKSGHADPSVEQPQTRTLHDRFRAILFQRIAKRRLWRSSRPDPTMATGKDQ